MFKKIFTDLCNERGIAPTKACIENGLSNAAYSCWTEDTMPRKTTLLKFAKYFGVSVEYLEGKEQKTPTPEGAEDKEGDELWQQICRLDKEDRAQVKGYITRLLEEQKYQPREKKVGS